MFFVLCSLNQDVGAGDATKSSFDTDNIINTRQFLKAEYTKKTPKQLGRGYIIQPFSGFRYKVNDIFQFH